MKDVRGVEKLGQAHQSIGGYRYAGHEAVTEAIRASFIRHGIVQTIDTEDLVLHPGGHISLAVTVRWICADGTERSAVEGTIYAVQHCQSKQGNVTAQQVGQAISYACKNFAFKTLMLLGDNEPDSDTVSDAPQREAPRYADAGTEERAKAMLAKANECKTLVELAQYKADCVKAWAGVKDYPGFGGNNGLWAAAFKAATARIGVA